MTEQEWLISGDSQMMLDAIRGRASDRKLRLFACAVERQRLEQYAHPRENWRNTWYGLESTEDDPLDNRSKILWWFQQRDAADVAAAPDGRYERPVSQSSKAALLRDIFGNPWRPVYFANLTKPAVVTPSMGEPLLRLLPSSLRDWNDRIVPRLAQEIYDERAFDRMPILADALEEAGCTNAGILRHCRRPVDCRTCDNTGIGMDEYAGTVEVAGACPRCGGEAGSHVRGCWVLDLLLGKE